MALLKPRGPQQRLLTTLGSSVHPSNSHVLSRWSAKPSSLSMSLPSKTARLFPEAGLDFEYSSMKEDLQENSNKRACITYPCKKGFFEVSGWSHTERPRSPYLRLCRKIACCKVHLWSAIRLPLAKVPFFLGFIPGHCSRVEASPFCEVGELTNP